MDELRHFAWNVDGALATIAFDRPEKRNGLDAEVMLEFESLIHRVRDDGTIRVLIVTGNGPAFCGGADMTLIRDAADDAARAAATANINRVPRIIGRVFDVMVHMDVITIGAINGHAVGGGWSIAAGFDHTIAAEGAQFWLPEVELGMPFRGLANVNLTQRLGPALAKEAMILCRRFSAEELCSLRVINQVCPASDVLAAARAVADRYLAMPARASIATRREINGIVYGPQYY